jgi:hypothetical protein
MKPKSKPSTSRRKTIPTAPTMESLQALMSGLHRPFTNPTTDRADRTFGPVRPTKPGTQI